MSLLFSVMYPKLGEGPRRWRLVDVWKCLFSLFPAFVKELPSVALSLLPSTIMLHVLTLISANVTGPGDELDVTFQSKS